MVGKYIFAVAAPARLELVPVRVDARAPLLRFVDVSLRYKRRPEATLKNISFELSSGEVMAIIGPSGAGKSTMCGGLLGEVGVESGVMLLGQANLGVAGAQTSHLVSFVPQQPAMFSNLTVRQTLSWVAKLRLATDVNQRARDAQISDVVAAMELTNDTQKRIEELSGGQRKRVSTAMELLSDPLLLVLDEPTSGLDEGLDRKMMESLRSVARSDGRAVIVVTHSMVNIDRADKLLALTQRGGLSYFGPPAGLLEAFGAGNYAEVMDMLRANHVTTALPPVPPAPSLSADVARTPPKRSSVNRHLVTLVGREFERQWNSKNHLAASLGVGCVLTALLSAAASTDGLAANPKGISSMLIAFIVCLTFFSMAQSFAAIVDDRETIERESRWSISATSMVLARAITCTPLAVALGLFSTLLYLLLKEQAPVDSVLPHPFGLLLFAVLLPIAAMCSGILVSTVSRSLRQAVFVLMGVLALQVVMTGLAPPFEGKPGDVLKAVAYLTPSRWSSAGLGADHGITRSFFVDSNTGKPLAAGVAPNQLSQRQPSPFQDGIWSHDASHVYTAAVALVILGIVALIVSTWLLRRQLARTR
ncbi:ATP-binding cassette domain-containing protein [Gordonia sp. NPDC003424]